MLLHNMVMSPCFPFCEVTAGQAAAYVTLQVYRTRMDVVWVVSANRDEAVWQSMP